MHARMKREEQKKRYIDPPGNLSPNVDIGDPHGPSNTSAINDQERISSPKYQTPLSKPLKPHLYVDNSLSMLGYILPTCWSIEEVSGPKSVGVWRWVGAPTGRRLVISARGGPLLSARRKGAPGVIRGCIIRPGMQY